MANKIRLNMAHKVMKTPHRGLADRVGIAFKTIMWARKILVRPLSLREDQISPRSPTSNVIKVNNWYEAFSKIMFQLRLQESHQPKMRLVSQSCSLGLHNTIKVNILKYSRLWIIIKRVQEWAQVKAQSNLSNNLSQFRVTLSWSLGPIFIWQPIN